MSLSSSQVAQQRLAEIRDVCGSLAGIPIVVVSPHVDVVVVVVVVIVTRAHYNVSNRLRLEIIFQESISIPYSYFDCFLKSN